MLKTSLMKAPYGFKDYTSPRGGLKEKLSTKYARAGKTTKLPEDEIDGKWQVGRNPLCRLNRRWGLKKFMIVPNT